MENLIRGMSGTIRLNNKYHLFARINWWEDYSVEENYSIVSADMEMMTEDYDYVGTWFPGGNSAEEKGQILVGGNVIASMTYYGTADHRASVTPVNTWVKVKKANGSTVSWSSEKIYHNSDGTAVTTLATTKLRAYRVTDGTNHTFGTISAQTIELTTIPRASAITNAAAAMLGKACSVKWTSLAESFGYKLRFSLGDWSHTTEMIYPKTTAPYTYTGYVIPMDVAYQITDAPSGEMTVVLETYSGDTLVGNASNATFTVTVPENDNTRPVIADLVLSPAETPFAGLYVQGRSKVQATFTGSGKNGATIASAKVSMEGKSYTENFTTDYISGYGEITVTVSVTDTRGYTGSVASTIFVCAYSRPQINVSMCQRCDADGNADDGGTYLMIAASRSYSKVIDSAGVQHNFCQVRYRYGKEGETLSAWQSLLAGEDLATDTVQTGALLGSFAAEATYIVEVGVVDTVGSTNETSYSILTEAVFMHEKTGGKGMGLGKYCEEDNLLDVAWNVRVRGELLVGESGMTLADYIRNIIAEGG